MFDIILSPQSENFYSISDSKLINQLNRAFDLISNNPFYGKNIKKLKGKLEGLFRFRIGNYRIVYSVENEIKIISIIWIGKRKDAY